MKENNLEVKKKKRFKKTTDSNHKLKIAENIVSQNFSMADRPDKVWGADITYIQTLSGWVYLAVIIDFYSRNVVGYSIEDHMRAEMTTEALEMPLRRRRVPAGLIHHSDRGVQYASEEYRVKMQKYGIDPSMSRKGNCWDNSMTESFFATLKKDLVYRSTFRNLDEARERVSDYIDNFYNLIRRHTSIGNISPIEFEGLTRTSVAA